MINCQSVYIKRAFTVTLALLLCNRTAPIAITELADDPLEQIIIIANTPRTLIVNKLWYKATKAACRYYDHCFLLAATPLLNRNKLFNVPHEKSKLETIHCFLRNLTTRRALTARYQEFLSLAVQTGHWPLVHCICTDLRTALNPRMLVAPFNTPPLHLAAQHNQDSILRCLLFHGAPLNTQDHNRNTVLHIAARAGSNDCIKTILAAGIHPNRRNEHMMSTIGVASITGHVSTVRLLLNALESIPEGAESSSPNPLTELRRAILSDNNSIAEQLIKSGIDITIHDAYGRTALHYATMLSNEKLVCLLLDHNANPAIADTDDLIPFDCAAASGNTKITTLLIEADKKIGKLSKSKNHTALLALQRGHVPCFTMLIDAGYAAHLPPQQLLEAYHIALSTDRRNIAPLLLIMPHDCINTPSSQGIPLLCAASFRGNSALVHALLTHRANPNQTVEKSGQCFLWTPLHCAAARGHNAIIHLLLKHRADNKLVNQQGQTPLMLAATRGHQSTVLELLTQEISNQEKRRSSYLRNGRRSNSRRANVNRFRHINQQRIPLAHKSMLKKKYKHINSGRTLPVTAYRRSPWPWADNTIAS